MTESRFLERRRRDIRPVHPEGDAEHWRDLMQQANDLEGKEGIYLLDTHEPTEEEIEIFRYAETIIQQVIKESDGRARPLPLPIDRLHMYDRAPKAHSAASDVFGRVRLESRSHKMSTLLLLRTAIHELLHIHSETKVTVGKHTAAVRSGVGYKETQSKTRLFSGMNEALTELNTSYGMMLVTADETARYGALQRQWLKDNSSALDHLQQTYGLQPYMVADVHVDEGGVLTTTTAYQNELIILMRIFERLSQAEQMDIMKIERVWQRWYLFGQYQPVSQLMKKHYGVQATKVLSRWKHHEPQKQLDQLWAFVTTTDASVRDAAAREFIAAHDQVHS